MLAVRAILRPTLARCVNNKGATHTTRHGESKGMWSFFKLERDSRGGVSQYGCRQHKLCVERIGPHTRTATAP